MTTEINCTESIPSQVRAAAQDGSLSAIKIDGLSCSERRAAKAGTGWWIRVGGKYLTTARALCAADDCRIVIDAAPGTPWEAGIDGVRGTVRAGKTRRIAAVEPVA